MKNGRVEEIRNKLGLSQEEFGRRIALAKSTISSIEAGNRVLNERTIKLICQEFNVDEEWLRTGEGDMFTTDNKINDFFATLGLGFELDRTDKTLIMEYLRLEPAQRKAVKAILKRMASSIDEEQEDTEEEETGYAYYPTRSGRIAGGHPILAIEEQGQTVGTNIRCDVALDVVGDSMAPDYPNGSTILVKHQEELVNGDLGVILICDGAEMAEATFKRFYQEGDTVILKPINPAHDPQMYPAKKIRIYGKVVGMA
jgi:SOS-response transcriptional repressor LexA